MEYNGIRQCLNHMQGAYCTRKLTEFIVSLLSLIAAIVIMIIMLCVVHADKASQLALILGMMAASLIANIVYCFYNETYWLYSVEEYFYNLYYLFIVLYICKAYLLKLRKQTNNNTDRAKSAQQQQKLVFYTASTLLLLLYTAIFIIALIRQSKTSYLQEEQPNPKIKYCSEMYYLIFDCLCVLGSIIVVIFLYKNHVQEMQRYVDYDSDRGKVEESLLSQQDFKLKLVGNKEIVRNKLSNPLRYLWLWIVPNVLCQIINLVEAGLLLDAKPPNCLLIPNSYALSNYISLVFLFFTEYLGFIVTMIYVVVMKVARSRARIDRTIQFSGEMNVEGNIELFYPSRQQPIDI